MIDKTRLKIWRIPIAAVVSLGLLAYGTVSAQANTGQGLEEQNSAYAGSTVTKTITGTQTVVTPIQKGAAAGLTLPGQITTDTAKADTVPAGLFEGKAAQC